MPDIPDTTLVRRAGNSRAMRAIRDDAKFDAWTGGDKRIRGEADANAAAPEPAPFYARPRFTSTSGRTVEFLDAAGMQRIAEEHEWLRDRVAHLELTNALLRSVIEAGARPVACAEPATV